MRFIFARNYQGKVEKVCFRLYGNVVGIEDVEVFE